MVGWSYWGNLDVTSTLNGLVFIEPCNARWVWNEKNHGTYSKLAIACGIWYDDQPSGIWVEVEAWMDWTLGNSEIMRQILATSSWKTCSIFRPKVEGSTQYWMFGIPLWWLDEGVPCANFQRPGPDFFFFRVRSCGMNSKKQWLRRHRGTALGPRGRILVIAYVDPTEQRAKFGTCHLNSLWQKPIFGWQKSTVSCTTVFHRFPSCRMPIWRIK